jgi:hypothetical protein
MIAKISTAMPSLIVFVLLARARKSDAPLRRLQMPNDRQPRITNPSIPKDSDMIETAAPGSILLIPEAMK